MTSARKAPSARSEHAGAKGLNDTANVGFAIVFSYHQQRIYNLLSDGIPRSAADITISLRMSDPRSVIRDCGIRAYRLPMNGARACTGAGLNGILFGKEGCNNVKEKQ